jgi:hypothetical protein
MVALEKSASVALNNTCTLFHFICTNQLLGYASIAKDCIDTNNNARIDMLNTLN